MARHTVPESWKTGMVEVGPRVWAYVQATRETGISGEGVHRRHHRGHREVPGGARAGLSVGAVAPALHAALRPQFQELPNETHLDLDVTRMLEGMERWRGARSEHACL
jgi:hypothetical protein